MTSEHDAAQAVDVFFVLDLDRTLLDTDELAKLLAHSPDQLGLNVDHADFLSRLYEQNGKAVSLLEMIRREYGDEALESIMELAKGKADTQDPECKKIAYPGAGQLLMALESLGIGYGIVTFGRQKDQSFKVELLERILQKRSDSISFIVTQRSNKTELIDSTWKNDEGLFTIPLSLTRNQNIRARSIVLLDDKVTNLTPSEPGIRGILVDNTRSNSSGNTILDIANLLSEAGSADQLSDIIDGLS